MIDPKLLLMLATGALLLLNGLIANAAAAKIAREAPANDDGAAPAASERGPDPAAVASKRDSA